MQSGKFKATESPADAEHWMAEALVEAGKARGLGEVPVGAVLVLNNRCIARAHNEMELRKDATAHAEMLALQRGAAALGDWRLTGSTLYVTLEPCSMCIGALILARVEALIFGCYDERQGAAGSLYDLSSHPGLPHQLRVLSGVREEECRRELELFFSTLRT